MKLELEVKSIDGVIVRVYTPSAAVLAVDVDVSVEQATDLLHELIYRLGVDAVEKALAEAKRDGA